jgi:hypothetical protein
VKKTYRRPELTAYGRMRELTHGSGGHLPDYNILTFQQISASGCNPSTPNQVGCLVSGS